MEKANMQRMQKMQRMRTFRACTIAVAVVALCASAQAASKDSRWVSHPSQPFDILATEATADEFAACVKGGKCEAATADAACTAGDESKGKHPINCINHDGAEALCGFLGGRLCSSKEWLAACRGDEQRKFPYGAEYQPSRCHVGSYDNPGPGGRTTIEAGSVAECEGGIPGLRDMSGNVSEWIADCKGDYCKFRGAAYVGNEPVDYFAGCTEVCAGNDKGLRSNTVGVRCCRDRKP
jgi:formylglycine-generating enzyme required for sulfatase activity